ncbi:hypothetical protein HU200_058158 [Digitaria exilis]|uniref:Uncharacterized protein n=1 Tax=Digitaria exilis TaxID=1010633 RepID=A0A835AIK6_9POAL|nr:hypothetical protein HU200_058158 [Digitaria exilis]
MSSPPVASILTWADTLSEGVTLSSSSTHISASTFHRCCSSGMLAQIRLRSLTPSARMASSRVFVALGWKAKSLTNMSPSERQRLILRCCCIL